MAKELSITNSIQLTNGEIKGQGIVVSGTQFDQTGNGYQSGSLTLSAGVDTVVPVNELTTPGLWVIQHAGSAGTLEIGPESGGVIVPLDKLKPGEVASGRIKSGVVLRVQAITADLVAAFFIAED